MVVVVKVNVGAWMAVQWKVPRPPGYGAGHDIWTLSPEDGAIEAFRKGGMLRGREQIERFGPNADSQGRLWPGAFRHNPWTGERLDKALELIPPISGRFGSSCGLAILDAPGALAVGSKRATDLKQGSFYFGQGGTPGFLYAADLQAGSASRLSRLAHGWIDHGRYPRSDLPPWANGLAGSLNGVFYAGKSQLVRLNEDPEDDGAETYPLGEMVAAPVALTLGVAAPYISDSGFNIGWMSGGATLRRHAATMRDGLGVEAPLSAPVVGRAGTAYWIGNSGFLSFEITRAGPEAVWRPWPVGFQAKPFLRPYRTANGQLWVFGVLPEGEGTRAATCHMTVGDGAPEVQMLEGPHVSAGDHTYRGLNRYSRPWAEPEERIQPGLDMQDRWLLPIVTLTGGETVVALVAEHASMRAFIFREEPARARLATLFLHRPNAGLTPLEHTIDLATTDDIDVFVSDQRLHIYHRDNNECVSWSLV